MNILVTGGAGYIGSVLTEVLLSLGHRVTVVETFLHGYSGILHLANHANLEVINRDIRSPDKDYLKGKDVIFHLAALAGNVACERNQNDAFAINDFATSEIARLSSRDALLIFASTTAIYGDRNGKVVGEKSEIHPNGFYSLTKWRAEQKLKGQNNIIVLRLSTIYGVSSLMRPYAIVNDFVRWAVQEKTLDLYNESSTRPYMHIQDCINGLIFAMENSERMMDKTYNLRGANYSKRNVCYAISKQVEYDLVSSEITETFPQNLLADFSRIRDLGFHCQHTLDDGIRELIKLYSFYRL